MARNFLIVLLALGIAGFGGCSFCGGMMGIGFLGVEGIGFNDLASMAFMFAVLGAGMAWWCWWGLRQVLRRGKPDEAPREPGQP